MKLKRIMAIVLCFAMVLSTMSFTTFAAEADYVAKIGETVYSDFSAAMADANSMSGDVEVEIYGSVEFTNGMELNGSYDSITFIGMADGATITVNQSAGGDYLEAHGKTVAFEDLTLDKANPAWTGNSGHMGENFSVQGGEVTYTDCTFPNGACTSGGTAVYTDCTFQNVSGFYGLWVYDDAYVTVSGGTIDSAKAIKVYSEGDDSVTSTLTVENATFTENVTAKPAVAIGYAESITLIGNTYNNPTGVLELDSGSDADCNGIAFVAQDADGNDITSTLTATDRSGGNAACGVFVTDSDGNTSIYTSATKAAEAATEGDTVTLLYDTEEEVEFAEGVTLDTNGYTAENITVEESTPAETVVATVNGIEFTDIQEAIEAAVPSGTVEVVNDVTVDKWIMFAETMNISNGNLITLNINGLTINGNNKTLTIKSIESAGNGNRLFYDAQNLNINNLTIEYIDDAANQGGIGLQSGTLSGVNFVGGGYGVLPQDGDITINGCTFATNGTAIYYEDDRDNLKVTNNTFNQPDSVNVILLRGDTEFTGNTVNSGRTVNVVSGSPVVTGNDFGDVRLKVYNAATATIEDNTINVLEFSSSSDDVNSAFGENTYSEDAEQALKDAGVINEPVLSGAGTETDPYVIDNLDDLMAFRDDVNAGNTYEGKYVLLTDDIDFEGYEEMNTNYEGNNVSSSTFRPIGDYSCEASFKGTFDGGDKTISNLFISGWDINYCWGKYGPAGLFGTVENATIKNLTMEGVEIQVEGGDVAAIAGHAIGDCTFENITVTDSKIATYNNGCAGIVSWSEAGNYTFKDIEITDSVVLAGLWGSFDSSIGGVLAQADENGTYTFEDVTVACRLDCYNDVTASYKWYSYRMCGMLIGRMTTLLDGTTDVDPRDSVTLKNVDITIGEWANYTYIWDDSLSKGCQRVEPGYTYGGVNVEDYPDAEITMQSFSTIIGGPQSQSQGYYGSDITKLEALEGFEDQVAELEVEDLAKIARSNVAKIDDTYFASLQDAVNAASDGDVITLINNINLADADLQILDGSYDTYFLVEGKNITIDLNGKTISGAYTGSMLVGVFSTDKNGHLTITGNGTVDVTATGKVYALVACYNDGSTITIENGTYELDKASDSLIFYGGKTDGALTVKGGTFTLGNVGSGENGKPWIFNVVGAGDHHVLITGGTFNADINRQHWSNEAVVDENCYTVNNGNGTYTVKEGAVAYVNTGMTTGPFYAPKNIGYATLTEAIAAAVATNDSPVVLIKDITENITITDGATVVVDLNGNTLNGYIAPCKPASLTVKNGSIVNANGSYSAIEINSGNLVIEDVNVESARHGVRIDGAVDAVINGGVYKLNATSGTRHAVNVSGAANVTIKDGTFIGPKGTTMDSGSAVCVQSGANVTIEGGNFSGGKNATLGVSGTMTVYGGTFDQDPSAYVADDYAVYEEGEPGKYVVEEEMVAKIGDVKFKTLQNAVDAAQEGDVIVIRNDFDLNTIVTVVNGKKITLDLNGKTITGIDNTEKNFSLIDNRGDLTITGNGTMTLTATVNSGWNRYSAVLANNPGGKLTIENGTIEHLGGTDMAYGIDNLTNGKGTYAETIVNGGTIKSTYRGIRQFLNGVEAQNILTVTGGTIEGANKSIWMHDPSTKANTGKLTVADGATLIGDVYLFVTAGSTEWPVEVSIAKSAVNGEVLSANVPVGYEVIEENGYYGIKNTTSGAYTVEAIADKTEVRYNNNNTADSFTVKYVVTGGNVIGAMAQLEYDNTLFICAEDSSDNDGVIRMNSNALTTDANGETIIKELHFTVKKNVDVDTPYTFKAKYVQVVSDYDAAGSGAQDGYVENVIGEEVTVIAQHDVTLDTEGALAGNTYVDADADYSATINNFDENKTYTITYTMGGVEQPTITVTKDNDVNSGFVIENVTGDIVFTSVTSELNFELVLLPEAVTGHTLVLVKDGVSAGYKYNDVEMYAVDRYVGLTEIVENTDREEFVAEDGVDILGATSVRAILIEGGVTLDEARAAITVYNKASDSIEKSFDVNRNGKFFFNDAMTAFGCYGKQYDVALELAYYLASDVNTDFMIDTDDYDDTVEAFWATLD